MIVALVGCSGPKLTVPARARDLYQSDLFRKARAYAESHADRWAILSARHGLLFPDTITPLYERSMRNLGPVERELWRTRTHLALHHAFPRAKAFLFLAGDSYRCDELLNCTQHGHRDCVLPFEFLLDGLQIGQRKRWLREAA